MRGAHGHRRGFSLVEVLVALAIAALLATIAWPGYRQVLHRSHRIEARLALLQLRYLQERHYADHHAYAGELRAGGGADALPIDAITDNGNYDLSVALAADAQSYVAFARARRTGRQAADARCQRFSIDTTGSLRSAAAGGGWRAEPGAGCWG